MPAPSALNEPSSFEVRSGGRFLTEELESTSRKLINERPKLRSARPEWGFHQESECPRMTVYFYRGTQWCSPVRNARVLSPPTGYDRDMPNWVKVKRSGYESVTSGPFVTVREKQIAFNAVFSRLAELDEKRFVVFFTDDAERLIKMCFSAKPDDPDAYTVAADGGGRGAGRSVQAGALLLKPWVAAVARQSGETRRFVPQKAEGADAWMISLMPSFEERTHSADDIPSEVSGIYRYVDKAGEVVYIGRGAIRARAKDPSRKDWLFETIEYSVLDDPDAQEEWERFWIDRFQDEMGALPAYNKIRGTTTSK